MIRMTPAASTSAAADPASARPATSSASPFLAALRAADQADWSAAQAASAPDDGGDIAPAKPSATAIDGSPARGMRNPSRATADAVIAAIQQRSLGGSPKLATGTSDHTSDATGCDATNDGTPGATIAAIAALNQLTIATPAQLRPAAPTATAATTKPTATTATTKPTAPTATTKPTATTAATVAAIETRTTAAPPGGLPEIAAATAATDAEPGPADPSGHAIVTPRSRGPDRAPGAAPDTRARGGHERGGADLATALASLVGEAPSDGRDITPAAPGAATTAAPRASAAATAKTQDPGLVAAMTSAFLAAAGYNLISASSATAAPQAGAAHDATPVAALAAAAGRALGSPGAAGEARVPGSGGEPRATAATPPLATADTGFTALTMTPLEQAVHELVDRLAAHDGHGHATRPTAPGSADAQPAPLDAHAPASALAAMRDTPAAPSSPAHAAAATTSPATVAAAQLPEPPANPSHVHLVVDDGPERVVVTVAMRGNDVHVALRATDDTTAAALARNAASLDHAMRARGLALGELTTEREPRPHQQPQDAEPRERPTPDAEPFELED